MKGSAADILVKYLEQEGVEYLFGVPGGHLLPLYDAIHRSGHIKPVLTKHEGGAAFMACGYALTSGKIGVCCGTVGPGATNLLTGVASAYVDSIPMLVLTAQVGTASIGKGALQEAAGVGRTISQVGIFQPTTKMTVMEVRGSSLPETLRRALRVAQAGRPGPVHIDLPADVQAAAIEEGIQPVSAYRPVASPQPDLAQVQMAADLLLGASRPAILVGHGVLSPLWDGSLLVSLAEQLQLPVATTLRAKGAFPEDHPLAIGCVGLYGSDAANRYMRSGTDVLLSLGASMHEFTTHVWDPEFQPRRALIQVDSDPTEIGKNYPARLGLVSDACAFLSALPQALAGRTRRGEDMASLKRDTEYFAEPAMRSDAVPPKPQRLMAELRRVLPKDATVLVDVGNMTTWAERCLPAFPEGRFIALTGLAAMGSATAACIGAKLGRPDKPAICICGDGDFMMTGMEVATAASHGISVVWVIGKNSRLAMIHDIQSLSYEGRHPASTFRDVNFVDLASSLGATGYRAERPADIAEAVAEALRVEGPAVVEVPIDAGEMPPLKPRMMAMRRSLGLPDPMGAMSWEAIKAVWSIRGWDTMKQLWQAHKDNLAGPQR